MDTSTNEPPLKFHLLSQESIIEIDFNCKEVTGVTSFEIAISSRSILPLLNFHIGFLEIRHLFLNGITLTRFYDERPSFFEKANSIKNYITTGISDDSITFTDWKCPTFVNEYFHGGINTATLSKPVRPGPPLFGSLYLHLDPDLLQTIQLESIDIAGDSSEIKYYKISLEIHFSLSNRNDNGLRQFYPVDKNIPLLGYQGVLFFSLPVTDEKNKSYFFGGPISNIGYLGPTIPSAQVLIPIMGLHLNVSNRSMTYFPAPRTVATWKLAISVDVEWIKTSSDEHFNVISSGHALEPHVLNDKKLFTFVADKNTIIPWAIGIAAGSFHSYEIPNLNLESTAPLIIGLAPSSINNIDKTLPYTLEHVEKAFEYYQWMLQTPYPWPTLKIIFGVSGLLRPFYVFSGGLILIE